MVYLLVGCLFLRRIIHNKIIYFEIGNVEDKAYKGCFNSKIKKGHKTQHHIRFYLR